jgi:hypothetical protein
MHLLRSLTWPGLAATGGLVLATAALTASVAPSGVSAAVMGGARALPYPEAVQVTRRAAEAVLDRSGKESCLRGKLTNALLGLSASCGAAGESNALCALADRAVVQLSWPLDFMDETSRGLLELIKAGEG